MKEAWKEGHGGPEGVFKKVSLVESLTLYAIDF